MNNCYFALNELKETLPSQLKVGTQFNVIYELIANTLQKHGVIQLFDTFGDKDKILRANQLVKIDLILAEKKLASIDTQNKYIFKIASLANGNPTEVNFLKQTYRKFKDRPFAPRQCQSTVGFRPLNGNFDCYLVTEVESANFVHFVFEMKVGQEKGEILSFPIIANTVKRVAQ